MVSQNAKIDENSRATLIALASDGSGDIVDLYADKITHRLLTDSAGGGGHGTYYAVTGTIDGSNATFTIPVEVGSDFLLWFERQSQMLTDDFTYVVNTGLGTTTITYVAGHQPFSGATLHKAFVIS